MDNFPVSAILPRVVIYYRKGFIRLVTVHLKMTRHQLQRFLVPTPVLQHLTWRLKEILLDAVSGKSGSLCPEGPVLIDIMCHNRKLPCIMALNYVL